MRSLSCEVYPKKEGKVYFGDPVRGHFISTTFFLRDAESRGFYRWYSIVVFMKDKHFLLNSWPFFQERISDVISQLQERATSMYLAEQKDSERAFRLSTLGQRRPNPRSIDKITDSPNVFAQLHLWFTWLLSAGAQRLVEEVFVRPCALDCDFKEKKEDEKEEVTQARQLREYEHEKEAGRHLRQLREVLGRNDFLRLLYSTLIGRQIVIRGHEIVVSLIIDLLQFFLPAEKFRCQVFGDSYQSPEVCNIVGVDFSAAVPKSSKEIMRLDIVPSQELGAATVTNRNAVYKFYSFIVKNESKLPDKLPSLLEKIEDVIVAKEVPNYFLLQPIKNFVRQWVNIADVIKKANEKEIQVSLSSLMRQFGIQEQDKELIQFWCY